MRVRISGKGRLDERQWYCFVSQGGFALASFDCAANNAAPLAPIPVDGNASLQVTMDDNGEPGFSDTIGITVWNKSGGLWFASKWNGVKTVEQLLNEGNLVVR